MLSKIQELQSNLDHLESQKMEITTTQMMTKEEHDQEMTGLVQVIHKKDEEIYELQSQIGNMQDSLKHLLEDLHKSKLSHYHNSNPIYSGLYQETST